MLKVLEVESVRVAYSAQYHTKDDDGNILKTQGHLGTREISLEYFPENLREEISNFIIKAELDRIEKKQRK